MTSLTIPIATLGLPRIGARRALKHALEAFWSGKTDYDALEATARSIRAENWQRQRAAGIDYIASNDFSLYDQMLDTLCLVGAVPNGYGWTGGPVSPETYFALARGSVSQSLPALEMTKWFDTNYHYLVPQLTVDQQFVLASDKPVAEFLEAKSLGIQTRPVLIGPVTFLKLSKPQGDTFDPLTLLTFLKLSKPQGDTFDPLTLLDRLLPIYAVILSRLAAAGADWVQLDEPCLALDTDDALLAALEKSTVYLAAAVPTMKLMLTSYFGPLGAALDRVLNLPVAGVHLDLTRGAEDLPKAITRAPERLTLSLGILDGRNVWRADLRRCLTDLAPIVRALGAGRVILAPSCSLLHVPLDIALEGALDPELRSWLSFAVQKLDELAVLRCALTLGEVAVAADLAASEAALASRRASPRVTDPAVRARLDQVTPIWTQRSRPFADRQRVQRDRLKLPAYPTTTIGSFPQTDTVRQTRAAEAKGALPPADYTAFLQRETEQAIRWQEEIGLDVLVHGEFERNDMVQYFGEQLSGYAFTQHGWVQSYGSRYVRPPILFGDVSRPKPMTVDWARYAQSLTERPVKGMLTGPVTMLFWSFVRDDLPRPTVCRQIALALRDEVCDLEAAGIAIIQIDEPAFREGLPLHRADWGGYLAWATDCFRLTASGVGDATQIHTHMCYSEFNDIIGAIAAMDADVISIETSRSQMELLRAFETFQYPNEIGPGVYDIHSPRVPTEAEMVTLLRKAGRSLAPDQLWVNPDCGLKTRRWEEVKPALQAMVAAAQALRAEA